MEWNCVIDGRILKEKHEKLVFELSEAYDALYGLKEKVTLLPGIWKGSAIAAFVDAFTGEWEKGEECFREMGRMLDALVKAEQAFQRCEEKQISEIVNSWNY